MYLYIYQVLWTVASQAHFTGKLTPDMNSGISKDIKGMHQAFKFTGMSQEQVSRSPDWHTYFHVADVTTVEVQLRVAGIIHGVPARKALDEGLGVDHGYCSDDCWQDLSPDGSQEPRWRESDSACCLTADSRFLARLAVLKCCGKNAGKYNFRLRA